MDLTTVCPPVGLRHSTTSAFFLTLVRSNFDIGKNKNPYEAKNLPFVRRKILFFLKMHQFVKVRVVFWSA